MDLRPSCWRLKQRALHAGLINARARDAAKPHMVGNTVSGMPLTLRQRRCLVLLGQVAAGAGGVVYTCIRAEKRHAVRISCANRLQSSRASDSTRAPRTSRSARPGPRFPAAPAAKLSTTLFAKRRREGGMSCGCLANSGPWPDLAAVCPACSRSSLRRLLTLRFSARCPAAASSEDLSDHRHKLRQ